ncbi:eEF1A lysine and N-terminal methyltransferase homolog [Bombus terrestris]|uniref:EEF1A lysine and N-terminal methyltransferase homolog n=1 Tax=Bombus terrestris TaxID=30195 RepID=A0A9B2JMV0_BOMTE|nr:eEF1A lysine and N-terminal methyltransferase homolog [Bombus terrestris]XP_012171377.2 eEF1A lysine and N-terminal methyltransferase homolog [Bombus terrestris]XP_020722032.2 eEF1A lysine and N-terminal methyltransferase homolog [Bombus terrestris]XP_048268175.1 eEF1A lysine and N-terminal methyltransferase homolog [Bombus terrestris]
MNILPKTHEEFSQVEYWNTFFKKRGKRNFEWYGEYPELCGIFLKYIKVKDNVLIVGCGNSTVSMCLYDAGYRNITNIDISHIVIRQMRKINAIMRPELVYEHMDATQMVYDDSTFNVVLDKGTLDALMPDTKEGTVSNVNKYFKEITRILRDGGRYICISLLQEHILRQLLSYFPNVGFMFRIVRCHEAEEKTRLEDGSSIPVFAIIATKIVYLSQTVLEVVLIDGAPRRLSSIDEMISAILSVQQSAFILNSLQKRSVADIGEISLNLHSPDNKHPRYTIYVLDQPKVHGTKSYAAFIVPQGKETDWLFSTKEGRQQVLKSSQRDRLAIVTLCREHKFENWEAVKSEIEDCILNLAPEGLPGKNNIPFLSLGSDVGVRTICFEGKSNLSGPFVVEEIERDGSEFRRLIFLNNPYVVQSEARLKQAKSRRGKMKKVVDSGFLACDHHIYMSIGVSAAINSKECDEIMIIGLGGGGLCTFLYNCFPKLRITAVEIDEKMLKVATDYFGLILDNRMKVEIADGIQIIKDSTSNGKRYKAILFDVDSKDNTVGMSCPPKQFLEMPIIKSVAECLMNDGFFILNLVSRDGNIKQKVKSDLKSVFQSMACYSVQDEVNEVIICSLNEIDDIEWKHIFKNSVTTLNKQISMRKLLSDTNMYDLSSLMGNLSIEF